MIKNSRTLLLLVFCTSCLGLPIPCQSVYQSESLSQKTKTFLCGEGGKVKYRCEKIGQCCEVGKNCEEDIKKKEAVK